MCATTNTYIFAGQLVNEGNGGIITKLDHGLCNWECGTMYVHDSCLPFQHLGLKHFGDVALCTIVSEEKVKTELESYSFLHSTHEHEIPTTMKDTHQNKHVIV